jgi:hypothetical protein
LALAALLALGFGAEAATASAAGAPSAPYDVIAGPATGQALVSWLAPASSGGYPISGYTIVPYIGSSAQTPLAVNNASATSATVTGLTNGTSYTFTVTATNSVGTSLASSPSVAVTPEDTIFDFTGSPQVVDSGDTNSVQVGVKFRSDADGWVTGVRFFKAAANVGVHIGDLWSVGGQLLASATFAGESASGWQAVSFSNPVLVTAGTTYVASYFAPYGHYSSTPNGFANGVDNPPLHAASNATSANGVYVYTDNNAFPSESYDASNYWVDVLFAPAPVPGQATNVSAGAAPPSGANVSWSAPASGGPATSYTITPYIGSNAQTPTTVTGAPAPTSATIDGLTPGVDYTFTVTADNSAGSGPASAASNGIDPGASPPSAPQNVTASPAGYQALVSWSAPADSGGSPITGYSITPYVGAVAQAPVAVSGDSATSAQVTGLSNGTTYTFTVTAINGAGTSPESGPSAPVTPQATIFDFSSTPQEIDSGDGSSVELGVKFTATANGSITGIRFYKSAANTGTHFGSLWDASGDMLAQATFSNETASGWQYVYFASPVAITANTTYVAGYFAPNGHYSATPGGLSASVENPPLTAAASPNVGNGVFAYSATSTFPTSSYLANNYWVDVLYAPALAPPGTPTNVSAAICASIHNPCVELAWSAPSNSGGGAITGYTITPYIGSTAQSPILDSNLEDGPSATVGVSPYGATYTFTVAAINADGAGPASAPSSPIAEVGGATTPNAPTDVTVSPASGQALVSWSDPVSIPDNYVEPPTGYTITPYVGSTPQSPVTVDNGSATSAIVSGLTNGTSYTFTVTSDSPIGSSPPSSPATGTPGNTIFDFSGPPVQIDSGDSSSVEVGVKFTADVNGSVTGIRFYKAAANTSTHIGNLWSANGTLLASATFSNETASGWQYVYFGNPVAIAAGITYVASYFAPHGHYSASPNGFASSVDNPPLHALANATSANGVYAYSALSTFPTNSYDATNYWVDLLFAPSSSVSVPGQPTGVSASPANASATVSWTPPSNDGGTPITGYTITPYIGSTAQTPFTVNDDSASSAILSGLTNGTAYTFTVAATNGAGSGPPSSPSPAATPQETIFDFSGSPQLLDSGDRSAVELGVKFTADTSGAVTGIRFYKAAANTGTHIGNLWSASGQLLASATFTNETASGWQTVEFSQLVNITANTTYVASYFAPNGHYSASPNGFASSVDNPPLHALANATSANGVYAYSPTSSFPSNSYDATSYWVDVLYAPPTAPGQVTGVTATAQPGAASVSWSPPTSGGTVSTYTITPSIGSTAQTPTTVNAPASSAMIDDLSPGTAYTFTVTASNSAGSGPASSPSSSVTPTGATAPDAPQNVTALPAGSQALVAWSAPSSDGGSAISAYTIIPYIGSTAQTPTTISGSTTSATVTGLSDGTAYTFAVTASNGAGTSPQSSPSPAATPQDTIFDFAGTPAEIDSGDSAPVELGVKFTADRAGSIYGLRFYKAPANTGTHIASLWDANGKLLAQASTSNETASGWQYVYFASPVAIAANTTYVAGYLAPNGHYSATPGGLSASVDNPPLHAVANSTSANGVYTYGATSTFPTDSYDATNYWVDVLFN